MKNNNTNKIIYGCIVLFVFLLYGNSIKNNYALDDSYVTTVDAKTPHLRVEKGIKGIPEIFSTHYIESENQSFEYRPIVLTTFALEYQFFKSNPHVSHFINVLIYAITCVLLFVILAIMFSNYNIILPLLITFLFIAHPIHTEVVNNLKSRDELLSFLFGISSLLFFMKSIKLKGDWKYILFAVILFVLGLMSKETAVLFIFIIPLTIYFFTTIKLKKIIFYGFIPLILLIAYKFFKNLVLDDSVVLRNFAFFENPLFYELDFFKRIPMAIYTFGYYLKLLVFPHPLSSYYGFNVLPLADWTFISVWISLLFHVFILGYAIIKLPKKSILSYGILIYLIGIFPFSNIWVPVVGIVGERFIYIASFGFCIGVAYFLLFFFKIDYSNVKLKLNKNVFKIICISILFACSIKIISRNADWKDELTLFRNDAKTNNQSYFLNYLAGSALHKESQSIPLGRDKHLTLVESQKSFKAAAKLLEEGLNNNQNDYYSMSTLGTIYVNYLGDIDRAIPWFEKSLKINPTYEIARFNLIFCYKKKNLTELAISLYEKMIDEG
ncbi:MAG: hypothetical protein HRT73_09815, partial [Flavobacteriales bacterium]|nr:hypothetical protein [Flavobacteriales bacterium]